jgi:hypothetical protein
MSGLARGECLPILFAAREAGYGPQRHLLQCSICIAIAGTADVRANPSAVRSRSSGLSPDGQNAGDFHRYNYRMDVAATATAITRYNHPDNLGSTNVTSDTSGNLAHPSACSKKVPTSYQIRSPVHYTTRFYLLWSQAPIALNLLN